MNTVLGYAYVVREFPDFIKLDGSLDGPSENLIETTVSGGVAMSDKTELLRRMAEAVSRYSGVRYVGRVDLDDAYAFVGPRTTEGCVVWTDYIGRDDNGGDLFAAVGFVVWE
jgi:hypothetical protein